jgi:nucleoid-associated protein
LDIAEKATLDIEKVDVANILNLNKWKLNDTTYLTFTKGRKQISEYFINFIGCTLLTDSRHYSKNLKAAFNDFLVSEKYTEEQKITYKMNAYSYLKEKAKSKTDINITEFANSLFPENPETLYNHLTKEEYQINPTFKCDMGTFKDYQYIFYNGKDLNFRFHRSLINDQRITYDKKNKTLTINKLDQSVINQIEQLEQDNQVG